MNESNTFAVKITPRIKNLILRLEIGILSVIISASSFSALVFHIKLTW